MPDFYIYTHSLAGQPPFYIGKGLLHRTQKLTRKNAHHTSILNKYGRENITIRTMLCRSEERALALEVKMIAALRNGGVKLANQTEGGEGLSGYNHTPEARAKMSATPRKSRKLSAEHKNRISAANTNPSAETRAKRSAANRKRIATPETRAKMSASQTGRKHTEEAISKMRAVKQKASEDRRNRIQAVVEFLDDANVL